MTRFLGTTSHRIARPKSLVNSAGGVPFALRSFCCGETCPTTPTPSHSHPSSLATPRAAFHSLLSCVGHPAVVHHRRTASLSLQCRPQRVGAARARTFHFTERVPTYFFTDNGIRSDLRGGAKREASRSEVIISVPRGSFLMSSWWCFAGIFKKENRRGADWHHYFS